MIKGFIYGDQGALFGGRAAVGFGTDDFFIREIDKNLSKEIIIKNHYSHKVYAAVLIHLGCFIGGELIGVLQFGYAMNPQSMASVVKGTKLNEYLELNRMWFDDKAPKNTASKAISHAIKYIKNTRPATKWVQSFADERCKCFGVVYQAANFDYYGEHSSIFWELDGVVYHNIIMTCTAGSKQYGKKEAHLQANKSRAVKMSLRQFRYIYFIHKREKKNCLLKEKPYPKHYLERAK